MSKKIKLLVEIDEEIYNEFMKENNYEVIYDGYWVAKAIANGTPITEGDTISRSALKKALDWIVENPYVDLDREIMEEIDNAQSIGGNQNE